MLNHLTELSPLRCRRWRGKRGAHWSSERRGAATVRLFLPSVHCGTVTGAKMADNREEISELVEKRGICRRVAPFIHRDIVESRRLLIARVAVMTRRVPQLSRDTRATAAAACRAATVGKMRPIIVH